MIRVKTNKNTVIIKGHANFDDYGKDIVCASVSSIVTTGVNNMFTVNKEALVFSDDGNEMIIQVIKEDELIGKLFNNLKALLNNLAEDYPENIKIESEE